MVIVWLNMVIDRLYMVKHGYTHLYMLYMVIDGYK